MNRRAFLAGASFVGLGAAAGTFPNLSAESVDAKLVRALRRITFGPRPNDVTRIARIGLRAFVEEQLAPERLGDAAGIRKLTPLGLAVPDLFLLRRGEAVFVLRKATLLRALTSERQVLERLVEVLRDHFSISAAKDDVGILAIAFDRDVIRRHALGSFRDLVRASLEAPAMLAYLDGARSSGASPNENHARELLELHTLGVHGGYGQVDVSELARSLTGFTLGQRFRVYGKTRFENARHDGLPASPLGLALTGDARLDLDAIASAVALHEATASVLAAKLCLRFAGSTEEPFVSRVAATFTRSRGNLAATLRAVLLAPELLDAPPRFLRPLRGTVSLLRSLEAESDGGRGLQESLRAMGELPFDWPTPDGFPDDEATWTGRLAARFRFAAALASGSVAGTSIPSALRDETPAALAPRVIHRSLTFQERRALFALPPETARAALFAHPEALVA